VKLLEGRKTWQLGEKLKEPAGIEGQVEGTGGSCSG